VSESQVIVVPRPPKGRKRSGGGYIGRSKNKSTAKSRRMTGRDREVAELLAGPDWKTTPEISAATGITENLLRPRLSRIRLYGAPEYVLLTREQKHRDFNGDRGRNGRIGMRTEYRVEKGKAQSASE
jgi:hypothetical protein